MFSAANRANQFNGGEQQPRWHRLSHLVASEGQSCVSLATMSAFQISYCASTGESYSIVNQATIALSAFRVDISKRMAATPNRIGARSDKANSNVFGHTWLIVNFAPSLFCAALLCCAILPSSPLLELISRPKDLKRLSRCGEETHKEPL